IAGGRHPRPHDGGVVFGIHTHIAGVVDPRHLHRLQRYLVHYFGHGRVWISAIEQPGAARDLLATAAYSWWRLANQDLHASVDDDGCLVEFFKQSRSLRFVE